MSKTLQNKSILSDFPPMRLRAAAAVYDRGPILFPSVNACAQ